MQATELLLQERVPRQRPVTEPRPRRHDVRVAAERRRAAAPLSTPHTVMPHTQFLSNGKYAAAVTNAGGGASFCDRMAVTRSRRDCDHRSRQPLHLPARHPQRRGVVADLPADAARARALPRDLPARDRGRSTRKAEEIATKLEIAVSPEHDVEVRLLQLVNHGDRVREIDVTSYVEIALAQARDDFAHPAFGKLFIETEYLRRARRADLPSPAARFARSRHVGGARAQPRWPRRTVRSNGKPIARSSSAAAARSIDPIALDGRPLSGTTGFVLDPIFSLRQRVRLPAGESVRVCFATGVAPDRETARALALTYRDPATATRTLVARARARAGPAPAHGHLERGRGAVRAAGLARARHRRLAARAGRRARGQRARPEQPVAARHLRRPADPARARRRR